MHRAVVSRTAKLVKMANAVKAGMSARDANALTPTQTDYLIAKQYLVANMLANAKKGDTELVHELLEYDLE